MTRPLQEEDVIPVRKLVLVAAGVVVVTLLCLAWVMLVMRPLEARDEGTAAAIAEQSPPDTAPARVDRTLFTTGAGLAAERIARQRERLESYGVVDAAQGTVRIPIERAMELVAAGQAP